MNTLVINSGSSSIKYKLFDMRTREVSVSGTIERIGEAVGRMTHTVHPDTDARRDYAFDEPIPDHEAGLARLLALITDGECGVLRNPGQISAVGHRVVHGGERFPEACVVDEDAREAVRSLNHLAPLHNAVSVLGIEAAMRLMPDAGQVVVADTAFFHALPRKAHIYPLPYALYEEHGIRRYGFHGTSHRFLSRRIAELLGRPEEEVNCITLHLGNGCSLAAIRGGRPMDTTMGMTPLGGVMMGTRCGDLDPAILLYLVRQNLVDQESLDDMLNRQSGLKGICGDNDMRDIHGRIERGDERARLALDMFVHRLRKQIGAYCALLGQVDAVVFSAGIGENDAVVRALSCEGMGGLGIILDPGRNASRIRGERVISGQGSSTQVWVVPTNEELEIAVQTNAALRKAQL